MKMKFFAILITSVFMCLPACSSTSTPSGSKTTESESHGDNQSDVINNSDVGITIDGFTNFDNTIAGKIPNAQAIFSFSDNVHASEGCTWKIYKNLTGSEEIPTKTIECEVGDNTVYLFAQSDKDSKLYTVIVRRRPLYKVTYESYQEMLVEEDSLIDQSKMIEPTKTGYAFQGWDYDFTKPITENVNIRAIWKEKEYTITFNLGGGTFDYASMHVVWGQYIDLSLPKKHGERCTKWLDEQGNEFGRRFSWNIDRDVELTAEWTDVFLLELRPDKNKNGQYYMVNGERKFSHNYEIKYGSSYELPEVTEEGYEFKGWFTSQRYGYADYSNKDMFKDEPFPQAGTWSYDYCFILEAKLEPIKVLINLDAGEGQCEQSSIQYEYDERMSLPTPTREGYTFGGWYDGDKKVWNDQDCKFLENKTLVARWEPNKYKVYLSHYTSALDTQIVLNINDQHNGINSNVYRQEYFTFTNDRKQCPKVLTQSGSSATFAGWYLDKEGTQFYNWDEPLAPGTNLYTKWNYASGYYSAGLRVYNNQKKFDSTFNANDTCWNWFTAPYTGEYTIYFNFEFGNYTGDLNLFVRKGKGNQEGEVYGSKVYNASNIDEAYTLTLDGGSPYSIYIEFHDTVSHDHQLSVSQNCYVENFYEQGKLGYLAEFDANYCLGIPEEPLGKSFVGWYTEENGGGTKLTDANGNSLSVWKFTSDRRLFAFFQ